MTRLRRRQTGEMRQRTGAGWPELRSQASKWLLLLLLLSGVRVFSGREKSAKDMTLKYQRVSCPLVCCCFAAACLRVRFLTREWILRAPGQRGCPL